MHLAIFIVCVTTIVTAVIIVFNEYVSIRNNQDVIYYVEEGEDR